jgi:class 3 adenylate cyclase
MDSNCATFSFDTTKQAGGAMKANSPRSTTNAGTDETEAGVGDPSSVLGRAAHVLLERPHWFAVAVIVALAFLPVAVWLDLRSLSNEALTRQVTDLNAMISEIRSYYSRNVVGRIQQNDGRSTPAHNYTEIDGGIPIPATLSIELGSVIGRRGENVHYRFVSDRVFTSRAPHQLDGFDAAALKALRESGKADNSERLQPEELTELLNEYFTEMAKIAHEHGATVDKFIGDAMLAFFGDPETKGTSEDAWACLEMAMVMQRRMAELSSDWRQRGIEEPFQIRIGINTGYCNVGNFGSLDRMDYTIIGAEANLAARLQSIAEPGGIVMSYETFALVQDRVRARPLAPIDLKGISRQVVPYVIEGV